MQFSVGDEVVYMPTPVGEALPPISQRPWDIGVIVGLDGDYYRVRFHNYYKIRCDDYAAGILPFGLIHHPLSRKSVARRFQPTLAALTAAVETRMATLVYGFHTGHTAQKGKGPADLIRAFLMPAHSTPLRVIPTSNAPPPGVTAGPRAR
jgi:hypothetical protein